MKKKLNLKKLSLQSFITSELKDANTIVGGDNTGIVECTISEVNLSKLINTHCCPSLTNTCSIGTVNPHN